jgi:NAD(P)-dependent dehydrogenase (short-subunit alcohol dehydrogenase family)
VPRPLEQAVVVVTGASSGIGRAAALRIARRGGSLALCALAGAAGGGRRRVRSDEEAVESFAAAVEDRFGRLDVWVNNAATMAYGSFDDIPSEVFRNVLGSTEPHQVEGGWRSRRRAALRRAFFAAAGGALAGLWRKNP